MLSSSWPYLQRLFHVPTGVRFLTEKLNICMGKTEKLFPRSVPATGTGRARKPVERSDLNASLAQGHHFIVFYSK